MDIEIACELMEQPPSRQSNNPKTIEINDPTTENIPQNESSHSRGGKYNLRPNLNPDYTEIYRYRRVQEFIFSPFSVQSPFSIFILFFFFPPTHRSLSSIWVQIHINTKHQKY